MADHETLENPRRRLGRGLSALLGGGAPAHSETTVQDDSELRNVPVAHIGRNPFQPRKDFDAEALQELAASVKEHGILQPILVRSVDGGFQLIAGERRWLAAQKAGLTNIPCRVVDVIDKTAFEFALEENLKRRDLHDLEKAEAFRQYIAHFECTVEELAKQLSMSRSAVSNMLRLLDLEEPCKLALRTGKITAGHARALLSLETADQLALCGRIQAESMSVRNAEAAARAITKPQPVEQPAPAPVAAAAAAPVAEQPASEPTAAATEHSAPAPVAAAPEAAPQVHDTHEEAAAPAQPATISMAEHQETHRTPHIDSVETQLCEMLGVKVQIKLKSATSGTIVIPFESNDDFERVLRTVRRNAA
ncbi:ParB/RepB/Spo0J family partition protein [Planctomyces sp. SH-PL14]|uniref:ParB/RepB/Spo0J family partition protein n=1 Tax=Planctomyces sp. SH-PL14 TaxID=1632864 RepID=UPI00078D7D70|nr:ParB/RepB/Spo0J family partition protein [Planctomyces sp. SH-PL14]AMV18743.1 Chromosome-partitioning protein Spo0J [Planctomyces sp. SH-PL14]